jgi:outer membrane protein assembly factor BamB
MALRFRGTHITKAAQAVLGRLSQKSGNILVYIIMIMVIFAVLGVAMVSLFSTSIGSSATSNDTRRATYLSEAGCRYASSELRAPGADFSKTTITTLNDTVYTVNAAGRFDLNIFTPWFEPIAAIDIGAGGTFSNVVVELPEGELPSGFISAIPTTSSLLTIVNDDYIDLSGGTSPPGSARGTITNRDEVVGNPKRLQLDISDDGNSDGFVAGKNETLCLAVKPSTDQLNVSLPGSLQIEHAAAKVFPAIGGAFEINRHNYYYTQAIDKATYVELTGVTAFADEKSPWKDTIDARTTDYVILSPRNRFIVSAGTSGTVTFGNSMDYATGVADTSSVGTRRKPDIDFDEETKYSDVLSKNESKTGFTELDVGKQVTFKRSGGTDALFASVLFKDTRAIGGQTGFCQNGRCLFGDGVRAFFIMTFTGPGDGFTFSLLNAGNNTTTSVGGDFELGELMGYAGDSRTDNAPTYLDGTGNGLRPPKMAVEFDGFYNNSPVGYCANATTVNENTRFDPDFSGSGKDTVQYVFWGNRTSLLAPCRGNSPLYDDNRHSSQGSSAEKQWDYSGIQTQDITQRIKIGPDGTIYAVSGNNSSNSDSRLVALDPFAGSLKWQFSAPPPSGGDDDLDAIAVDNSGHIYLGSDDNQVLARNPDGSRYWTFTFPFSDNQVESPMVISESPPRIYFGANAGGTGILWALNKTAPDPFIWAYIKPDTGEIQSGVALDAVPDLLDGDGTVYFGSDSMSFLYAVRTSGTARWKYPSSTPLSGNIHTQPVVNPSNRDVIFASTNGQVYALPYSSSSTPIARWTFNTGNPVENALAISPDGNTVYVGTTGGVFYALDAKTSIASGSQRWKYPSSGSIGAIKGKPAVGGDGTVYFGSEDGHVYALNPDSGSLTDAQRLKWIYPSSGSIGSVKSAIEIGKNENILFISEDGKLYSVSPFTVPPNLRSLYLTDTELQAGVSGSDWFGLGTWAVRVEVDRSQSTNANNKYEYTLRTWMRRCTDASGCSDIAPTLFGNTRLRYDYKPLALTALPMTQTIELAAADHTLFERFLFGFTSGSGSDQTINISKFQLSFIRPNDPVATADPDWP